MALAKTIIDLTEGSRAVVDFAVSASEMQSFAELSGDYNPLHLDEDFARRKGFKGVVVYGGLVVAKVSQLIGMHLPGRDGVWSSIAMQFHHPLFVEEPARVEGVVSFVSSATGMITLQLAVYAKENLVAKGKAEVLLVRS